MTAYGLAVKHGFKGTEEEWIESLNAYLHIKFSHSLPQSDSDMTDTPAEWMGIATTRNPDAPEEYTSYMWLYVKGEADSKILAPAYNEQATYSVGNVVSYGQGVYRCTTQVSTPEPFNIAKWTSCTISALIDDVAGIEDNAVTTAKIQDSAVTTAKINDGAVTTDKIGSKAVTSAKIADNAIVTAKIISKAVTTAKIDDGAVNTSKLADDAVTTDKIADNAVGTAAIADDAVNGDKLNLSNGDLPTIKLTYGVHYYNTVSEAPTQAGVLSFIKSTD